MQHRLAEMKTALASARAFVDMCIEQHAAGSLSNEVCGIQLIISLVTSFIPFRLYFWKNIEKSDKIMKVYFLILTDRSHF